MRRCRSHSNRRQYSRARSHSSHRTRPSGARHEHRRGAGLRHTGRVSVPAGTIVWLSAVRSRQSWPLSRLPNPARILQVPQNIRIVPVNAVGSVRSGHSSVRMDPNRGNPRPSSGCCFPPDCRSGHPQHRSRSRQQAAPCAPSRRGACVAHTVPGSVDAVPQPTVVYQASFGQAQPEHSRRNVATAPNSLRARRQIDSKKPPRYTRRHRVGPLPGGFLFPEWVAFFTGIRRKGKCCR